ncbi:hypothetical protein ACSQ67_013698 [Phaseolus vulgaris]
MIDESFPLINYVPSFARGFTILLVHDDKFSRSYLSTILQLYSFKGLEFHICVLPVKFVKTLHDLPVLTRSDMQSLLEF